MHYPAKERGSRPSHRWSNCALSEAKQLGHARKPLGRSQAIAIPLARPLSTSPVRKVPRHFLSLEGRKETASIAVVSDLRRRKGYKCGDEEGGRLTDNVAARCYDVDESCPKLLEAFTSDLPLSQGRRPRQLRFDRAIDWPLMKRKSANLQRLTDEEADGRGAGKIFSTKFAVLVAPSFSGAAPEGGVRSGCRYQGTPRGAATRTEISLLCSSPYRCDPISKLSLKNCNILDMRTRERLINLTKNGLNRPRAFRKEADNGDP